MIEPVKRDGRNLVTRGLGHSKSGHCGGCERGKGGLIIFGQTKSEEKFYSYAGQSTPMPPDHRR
jgi:hypothetical protein